MAGGALAALAALWGAASASADPPERVVSMNLCTDQLAMLIAAPGQLHSVSWMAADPRSSAMTEEARGRRLNHGRAEEIFLMRPDLVIAGTYTTRASVEMLRRLGFEVAQFPLARDFDDIRGNIRRMGRMFGREARAEALVAEFDSRLEAARPRDRARPRAALRHANGYSSGAGTLASAITEAAGFRNMAAERGMRGIARLPLEALVMAQPDLLITDREGEAPALAQEAMRHPALRPIAERAGGAVVTDQRWTCGAPFTAEAVADLAAARRRLPRASAALEAPPGREGAGG
ncbi:MAG: ABC transporter substrate-binding protein [Pseudomonadota bacterium]